MNQLNEVQIVANGKTFKVKEGIPLSEFLASINLPIKNVVVEHNYIALSPLDIKKTVIKNGDIFEIVQIVSGG